MKIRSLAARLTAWYVFATPVLVLATIVPLYVTVASHLRQTEAELVADRLHTLQAVLNEPADPAPSLELREEVEREWPGGESAHVYTRILDSTRKVFTETRGMKDRDLAVGVFPLPVSPSEFRDTDVMHREASGRVFSLYSVQMEAAEDSSELVTVQMAIDSSDRYGLLATYRRRMVAALVVSLLLAAGIGYSIARRGLEPVESIGRTLSHIESATLGERLDPRGLPVELALLATTCNRMLDGLEEAFIRLARFSADIAHELRTPINNLRGEVEVALARTRSAEEYRTVLGSCLEEAQRLSKLIDSLLFLARAEGASIQACKEPLDLAVALAAVAEFYEALASESGVELIVETGANLVAAVDRALFQSAVGNLVANAVAATPRGGRVKIRAVREGGQVRVEVSDTGRGIPAADLPHVFDRLYRVDSSRSGTGSSGGAGLGLAIVKGIMTLHGGTASIRSAETDGTIATLCFPTSETGKMTIS
jgi:two-component system heavy metal sensor histidine kinase CusS